MKSRVAYNIFRLVAGIAMLVWLVLWVDWRQLITAVRQCNPWWVAAGLGAFGVATIPAALRVKALFRHVDLTFGAALRLTFSSYFFNQLLPSGVGGDAYRSLRLKEGSGWISAVGLLVFERLIGAAALVVPALAYAIARHGGARVAQELRGHLAGSQNRVYLLAGIAVVIAAGVVILLLVRRNALRRMRHEVATIWRQLSLGSISAVIVLSVIFHGLRVLGMRAFLEAVGSSVAIGDLVIIMALTLTASLVPISIGALGVREGILVYCLGAYGVPHAEALTVALLARLVVVILGLIGGLVFYLERGAVRSPVRSVDEPGGGG